jgi:hypothetical protein
MEIKLLADRYGNKEAVEQLKEEWLYDLLLFIGVEVEVLEEFDGPNLYDFFFDNHIEILEFPSIGGLRVELQEEVVGEWGGPEYKLMKDKEDGDLYYEITIEYWSIMNDEQAE